MPATKPVKSAKLAVPRYEAAPLIDGEAALEAALAGLHACDLQIVGPMLAMAGVVPLRRRAPGFAGLVWIIISQQVSVASANAIQARVEAALGALTPQAVLDCSEDELKAMGLSAPKMRCLRALSDAIVAGRLDLEGLANLSPEEAHAALCAIKGIGPWTADIFLLFCLGHPDAWPVGDLALQEAARLAHGWEARPSAKQMEALGEKWRPHRGAAARLLWAYYKVCKDGRAGIALA